MREVFISYKSFDPALGNNDAALAKEICQVLEAAGITCWIAPRDIPYGNDYDDCIVEAIESCKVMLVLFSSSTLQSKYVYEEVRIAYDCDKDVIRIKLDDTQLRGKWNLRLGSKQWIDANGDYRMRMPELIDALQHKLGRTPVPTSSLSTASPLPIDSPVPTAEPTHTASESIFVMGVTFKMIRVEGGTFNMGATTEQGDDAFNDEKPLHKVSLSTYYIGQTSVTQELWQAVMGNNPSCFQNDMLCPVESVSWNYCQEFIARLNQMTGKCFRLPTEAEWEFAARGGNKSKCYKYAGSNNLDEVAWSFENSNLRTHPVATKKPNELGLYDMSGNVWEWCQDWKGVYNRDDQKNPMGASSGSGRVVRGGGWNRLAKRCRVSCRYFGAPSSTRISIGFRLALDE